MKINYTTIQENLDTYNQVKEKYPILKQLENGEITIEALRSVGLYEFGEFYEFLKECERSGYSPIMQMNWKQLKPILVEKTTTERFKSFIGNKTKKKFDAILNDFNTFDRLLNGRWISKPNPYGRGRGRRSNENVRGLREYVPMINYFICNDIDISNIKIKDDSYYLKTLRWYIGDSILKSKLDIIPFREIEITNKIMEQLVDVIDNSKIDFRKMNINYIANAINKKLNGLVKIENDTIIKSLNDVFRYNRRILTSGKSYQVASSDIWDGHLRVSVVDDLGERSTHRYNIFEDMSFHRSDLLSQLLFES
jgi:hypothetical protein